jgi:broad specificity phosphatase PhoE
VASEIYLIRHGETTWSLTGRHTGRTDLPLSARGEHRATRLVERLQDVTFTHVLTSPLQRASRTCELAGFGRVARTEPDLQEWDYGAYEGLTTEEINVKHPGWDVFRHGCPQGESVEQVSRRADRIVTILRGLDGTVAVFSLGHFLRSLAMRWIDQPLSVGRHFPLGTAAVSLLGFEHPDQAIPAIIRWNTVSAHG